jgi:hypothetical protein
MKIAIILIKFLFIGALFIVSNNNLYLSNSQDMSTFTELYYNWVDGLFDNTKQLAGYVVKSEWLPGKNIALLPELTRALQLSFYIPNF